MASAPTPNATEPIPINVVQRSPTEQDPQDFEDGDHESNNTDNQYPRIATPDLSQQLFLDKLQHEQTPPPSPTDGLFLFDEEIIEEERQTQARRQRHQGLLEAKEKFRDVLTQIQGLKLPDRNSTFPFMRDAAETVRSEHTSCESSQAVAGPRLSSFWPSIFDDSSSEESSSEECTCDQVS